MQATATQNFTYRMNVSYPTSKVLAFDAELEITPDGNVARANFTRNGRPANIPFWARNDLRADAVAAWRRQTGEN